jgi:hypothetical protein
MSEMVLSVLFISTASSRLTQEQLKELVDKKQGARWCPNRFKRPSSQRIPVVVVVVTSKKLSKIRMDPRFHLYVGRRV